MLLLLLEESWSPRPSAGGGGVAVLSMAAAGPEADPARLRLACVPPTGLDDELPLTKDRLGLADPRRDTPFCEDLMASWANRCCFNRAACSAAAAAAAAPEAANNSSWSADKDPPPTARARLAMGSFGSAGALLLATAVVVVTLEDVGAEAAASRVAAARLGLAAKAALASAWRFRWLSSLSLSVKPWLQRLQWKWGLRFSLQNGLPQLSSSGSGPNSGWELSRVA